MMHKPTQSEIEMARQIMRRLDDASDREFENCGFSKKYDAYVLAAGRVGGWLYVAAQRGEVRATLSDLKDQVRTKIVDEFQSELPDGLLDDMSVVREVAA